MLVSITITEEDKNSYQQKPLDFLGQTNQKIIRFHREVSHLCWELTIKFNMIRDTVIITPSLTTLVKVKHCSHCAIVWCRYWLPSILLDMTWNFCEIDLTTCIVSSSNTNYQVWAYGTAYFDPGDFISEVNGSSIYSCSFFFTSWHFPYWIE